MARNPEAKRRTRLLREQLEREAWIGQQFLNLLARARLVNLLVDGEVIRAEVTDIRGQHRSCEDQDVRDLLIAALGTEPRKQCHGPCGRTLPLSAYGHDKNKPDGRLLRCKRCEAERVRAYKGGKQSTRNAAR